MVVCGGDGVGAYCDLWWGGAYCGLWWGGVGAYCGLWGEWGRGILWFVVRRG